MTTKGTNEPSLSRAGGNGLAALLLSCVRTDDFERHGTGLTCASQSIAISEGETTTIDLTLTSGL